MDKNLDRGAMIEEVVRLLPQRNSQLGRLLTRQARLPLRRGMASILTAVGEQPRSITDLAEREGLAQPTVTRMITRLESIDLVERKRQSKDRRIVMVHITSEGRTVLNQMRARFRSVLRDELSSFSDGEIAALVSASGVLQRLIDTMQTKAGAGAGDGNGPRSDKPRSS